MDAIGLIEIQSLVAAIEALDQMCKTSGVKLVHIERRLGGRMVSLVVEGDVSSVTCALERGKEAAQRLGKVKGCEVIARPHEEIQKFLK
ncbi:MAG: BMC domain-containing protein [Clostridia bacterium]|nr:BMC domain-containing protein [Clostridia bacterium]